MKIGLYFGSFNPIHIGHMAIANYFIEFTELNEIWFVVSPHNPLKEKKTLLEDRARYKMVELAIENDVNLKACDIEFSLPQPSYTFDTLTYLKDKHPNKEFCLIMGSDGLSSFHKWKNYKEIIKNYTRYIYPRDTKAIDEIKKHENVVVVNAPRIEISSTFIRKAIKSKKNIRYFLPSKVYASIDKYGYYS